MQPGSQGDIHVEMVEHLRLELFEPAAGDDADLDLGQQRGKQLRHLRFDLGFRHGQGVIQVERHDTDTAFQHASSATFPLSRTG